MTKRSLPTPLRGLALAAFALLLGASFSVSRSNAAEVFGTNVRPYFSAGPSYSAGFDEVSAGFGVAFGFEAEQSSRFSALFRVEWNRMRVRPYVTQFYYPTPYEENFTAATWSLGARAYLNTQSRFRTYVDGGLGVRLVDDNQGGIIIPAAAPIFPRGTIERDGLAMNLRFGISSAPPGRPGFFLDSGMDMVIANPDDYALIPVRLGVVFP